MHAVVSTILEATEQAAEPHCERAGDGTGTMDEWMIGITQSYHYTGQMDEWMTGMYWLACDVSVRDGMTWG